MIPIFHHINRIINDPNIFSLRFLRVSCLRRFSSGSIAFNLFCTNIIVAPYLITLVLLSLPLSSSYLNFNPEHVGGSHDSPYMFIIKFHCSPMCDCRVLIKLIWNYEVYHYTKNNSKFWKLYLCLWLILFKEKIMDKQFMDTINVKVI